MKKLNDLYKSKSSIPKPNGNKISPKGYAKSGKRSFLPVRITNGSLSTSQQTKSSTNLSNSNLLSVINSETEPETTACVSETSKVDTKPLIPLINGHLKSQSIKTLALSMSNLSKFSQCQSCNKFWLLTNLRTPRNSSTQGKFNLLKCKYSNFHKYVDKDNCKLKKSKSFFELFSPSNPCRNETFEALIRYFYKNDFFEQKCNSFMQLSMPNQQNICQT